MKKKILSLTFLLAACGGGGGGGGDSSCGPGLNGNFITNDNSKWLSMGSCNFHYVNNSTGCSIMGTHPYTGDSSGSLALTVTSTDGTCGSVPTNFVCSFYIASSTQITLNCPAISVNNTFYKY